MFILLDDVGFAQLGCFGSDIRTPNIDRLAAGGLRYRDFHTTALCSPTRSCLLTGRNHHSNGVGIIQEMATGFPGYNGSVPRENGFLSEMLLPAGLRDLRGRQVAPDPRPSEYASGASKARWPLVARLRALLRLPRRQDQPVGARRWSTTTTTSIRRDALDEGYHLNEDLADRAIEFVTDLRTVAPDKPFFLYYCLGAGHSPHHVEREWIEQYRGQFDEGWDRWREARLRPPARDGDRAARHPALAATAVGAGLGQPVGRRAPPLRPPDGGARRRSWSTPTTTSGA